MAAPLQLQALPYEWNEADLPPPEVLNQWGEVGNGIDKSQTGKKRVCRGSISKTLLSLLLYTARWMATEKTNK